ncbi:MAG: hypothetical protein ACFFFC_19365 [Candidatus Thorarchaeota archaeon]
MGKYIHLVKLPFGKDEAARRIGDWLRSGETFMKVREKRSDFVRLKGRFGPFLAKSELTFDLYFMRDAIRFECWIGNVVKYSIEPESYFGMYPRDIAWAEYQKLMDALRG